LFGSLEVAGLYHVFVEIVGFAFVMRIALITFAVIFCGLLVNCETNG